MAHKRNVAVLVTGLLLIFCGAIFLGINVWGIPLPWLLVLKVLFPSLLLLLGLFKLVRHFTCSEQELLSRPARASLLGGIFWTSLGLVILLDVFGVLDTLGFFGAYWPVILIVYGLGKIVDYYRLRTASHVRIGEIFGVVFIATFGWSVARISEVPLPLIADLGWEGIPWSISLDPPVAKHQFGVKEALDLTEIETVEIRNLYGSVEVASTIDGSAEIELEKIVRGDSEAVAKELAVQVSIVQERKENSLLIETNRKELGKQGRRLNTNLILRLPDQLQTKVVNSYGDVSVEGRSADCELENSYGKITATNIRGDVSMKGQYQQIKATDIAGSLKITNRRASVIVRDVAGEVEVTTDYELVRAENVRGNLLVRNQFGRIRIGEIVGGVKVEGKGSQVSITEVTDDVQVSSSRESVSVTNLQKALALDTSYSEVKVAEVVGPVEIRAEYSEITAIEIEQGVSLQGRGSQVALADVGGELSVETSLRSVSVKGFTGPLSIQNEYGEVSVEASESPMQPLLISNKNGGITLSLPHQTNGVLSAHSVGGEIVSDFGPEPQKKSGGRVSLLETKLGSGGPKIELQTTQARIHIKKRG